MPRSFALFLVLSTAAVAQPFERSALDLTANGTLDAQVACATATSNLDGPVVLWFDDGTESAFVARDDGGTATTAEIIDAATIDTAAGVDVDGCRAAEFDGDGDVLYLVLSAGDIDFVAAVEFSTAGVPEVSLITTPDSGAGDGVVGLTLAEGVLYAAVRADLNDPPAGGAPPLRNGFYSFAPQGEDQRASPLALDDDLSLTGLTATANGDAPAPGLFALLAISDRDGASPYRSTVVSVTNPTGSPSLSVFRDPFDGLLPFGRDQGRLVDVVSAVESIVDGTFVSRTEGIFVLAEGPEDAVLVRYTPDGSGEVSATEESILAGLGRATPGYTPNGTASLLYSDDIMDTLDALLLINRSEDGGADEVLIATGAFVTPIEPGVEALSRPAVTVGPNPSAGLTTVEVRIPHGVEDAVTVRVFDVMGREVDTLHRGRAVPSAPLRLQFEAEGLPAGVYVVRAESASGRRIGTATVTLVR